MSEKKQQKKCDKSLQNSSITFITTKKGPKQISKPSSEVMLNPRLQEPRPTCQRRRGASGLASRWRIHAVCRKIGDTRRRYNDAIRTIGQMPLSWKKKKGGKYPIKNWLQDRLHFMTRGVSRTQKNRGKKYPKKSQKKIPGLGPTQNGRGFGRRPQKESYAFGGNCLRSNLRVKGGGKKCCGGHLRL